MEKFSTSLLNFSGDIENPTLRDSLKSLEVLSGKELRRLDWGNGKIAVPLEVNVDLPSLGNFEGLDIREIEPIVMVFDLINYPTLAPKVFTDRLDFPKNNLAHLYCAVNNYPPAFCYVRGDSNDWYANKRIEDLVVRVSNWLRDAATGELTENGSQYEPLRLEGYSGTLIYDYNTIIDIIKDESAFLFSKNLAIILLEYLKHSDRDTFKFVKTLTKENVLATIAEVNKENKKSDDDKGKKVYHYAFVMWQEEGIISKDYYVNLPNNWDDFKSFCNFYNIQHEELESLIAMGSSDLPVIVGIRRPRPLIGYSSNIEFINLRFKVSSNDIDSGKIINNVPVDFLSHHQPLTLKQAAKISGFEIEPEIKTGVFGCGALGSKVVMHLARSGQTNFTLLDPDHISPHNLVRHVLYGEDEGENKAAALRERIKKLYPYEKLNLYSGLSFKDGLIDKKETFDKYRWILDFTASEAFFNKLISVKSMDEVNIVSASISDFGNLGILYKEGQNRNPRIDDLQAYLFSLSSHDSKIVDWLNREQLAISNNNITIQVGVGCNSETTVLSDDKISSHASYFSAILKKQMKTPTNIGNICLNRIEEDSNYNIETKTISVNPFTITPATNDLSWNIRFKDGIINQIERDFLEAGNIETGGVLIGICNYKTKTIHVTDLINAPSDSKANSVFFVRGHDDLSAKIAKIKNDSGGQIGYVGEWHSHPSGPDRLSEQDMLSVYKHKAELSQLIPPLPVFLSIITPDGLFSYVY